MKDRLLFFSVSLLASVVLISPLYAAQLDELYLPLLSKGQIYSKTQFNYFKLEEDGAHGSASFGAFESEPYYPSLKETIKFAPLERWEVELGYGQDFNANYKRLTFNPAGDIAFVNKYDIDFVHHFNFNVRKRFDGSEIYLKSEGN